MSEFDMRGKGKNVGGETGEAVVGQEQEKGQENGKKKGMGQGQ